MNVELLDKNDFINENEELLYDALPNKDEVPYTQICISSENVYIRTTYNSEHTQNHVISISEIQSISIDEVVERPNTSGYIILGIIGIIVGLALTIYTLQMGCLCICGIGMFLIILGAVRGTPQYTHVLNITAGRTIEINSKTYTTEKLQQIRNKIFEIKNKLKTTS